MNDSHRRAVSEFAAVARGFCQWCEDGTEHTDSQAATWLSSLYSRALALPNVGPENEGCLPELPVEALQRAKAGLVPFVGRYYREVFDPEPNLNDDPVMGDIGDDLLDIYKDLRGGLALFERDEVADALWHWAFLHRIHWGRHAVGAMLALHCLRISREY